MTFRERVYSANEFQDVLEERNRLRADNAKLRNTEQALREILCIADAEEPNPSVSLRKAFKNARAKVKA